MLQTVLEGLPVVVLAFAYARRARTLGQTGRPVAVGRQLSFAAGLAVICVAIGTPVASVAEDLQLVHMVQHVLLGDIAALLLVLGLTRPLLQPVLAAPGLRHLRVLANPIVAFVFWIVSLYAWHLPSLYEAAAQHPVVHAVEHASFLAAGLAMWAAILGPLPKPEWFTGLPQLLYVFLMRASGAVLANIFIWSQTPFYPSYVGSAETRGIEAMTDQNLAGAVLMIEGSLLTFGVFAWLFFAWMRNDQERQELLELAAARGVALDERRVKRAIAAGRGGLLRERVEGSGHERR